MNARSSLTFLGAVLVSCSFACGASSGPDDPVLEPGQPGAGEPGGTPDTQAPATGSPGSSAPVVAEVGKASPPSRLSAPTAPAPGCWQVDRDLGDTCATAHQHLAAAMKECFAKHAEVRTFAVTKRCGDQSVPAPRPYAGFGGASIECCTTDILPASIPDVLPEPADTGRWGTGGFGGSSMSGGTESCNGDPMTYLPEIVDAAIKQGGEIVSFGADHLCEDLNYAAIGESVEIR